MRNLQFIRNEENEAQQNLYQTKELQEKSKDNVMITVLKEVTNLLRIKALHYF